jgi:hypothetical protein
MRWRGSSVEHVCSRRSAVRWALGVGPYWHVCDKFKLAYVNLTATIVVHLLDHHFRLLLIDSDCIPLQIKSGILA